MTCRHVLLDRMDDPVRRQESLVKSQIPEESYKFTYYGEDSSDSTETQPDESDCAVEQELMLQWVGEGKMQHPIASFQHSSTLASKDANPQQHQ